MVVALAEALVRTVMLCYPLIQFDYSEFKGV
jgi:hypothetical protein